MLLDFKIKNYKSFYRETCVSMIANAAQKDFKERLINVVDNKRINKFALPSMVIYGANASGKTSIISALNVFKQIVINGTIKNQIKNKDIIALDISPFIHDYEKLKEPMYFEITFKTQKYIYNYSINILASYINSERKILNEELNIINYKKVGTSIKEEKNNIFKRYEDKVELNKENETVKLLDKELTYLEGLENNFSQNLDKEDLFLTTGFKSMISLKIASEVLEWFQDKLMTVVDFSIKEPVITFDEKDADEQTVFTNNCLNELIKVADFGPQSMGYIKDTTTGKYTLNSFYKPNGAEKGIVITSNLIESKGTIKLINFWVAFLESFKRGAVFVLDEFDCSIHPELIGGIIDLFNNKEINKNNAQLIFNTHNPLYLQKRFFRRDQIMFVEKNREEYMSEIYKLSDFEVRNDASYMKNYFEGKFGALPFIDFESVLDYLKEGAD